MRSKVRPDALETRKRDAQILDMRCNLFMSEAEIGEQVGLSQSQVSKVLHRLLQERIKATSGKAEELVQQSLTRFEKRYRYLTAIAAGKQTAKRVIRTGKDTQALVDVEPAISDRISALQAMRAEDDSFRKMLGIDAPTRIDVRTSPFTSEELDKVAAVATQEELDAIEAGDDEVIRAVCARAAVPLH